MIVCSRCSKDNQDHYKFCLGCGAELPREQSGPKNFAAPTPPPTAPAVGAVPTVAPPIAAAAPAPLPREKGLQFAATQQGDVDVVMSVPSPKPSVRPIQVPEPAAVPPSASVAPPQVLSMRDCPSCSHAVPQDFKFCGSCGHKMAPATASAGEAAARPAAATAAPAKPTGTLVLINPDGSEGASFDLMGTKHTIGRKAGGPFSADSYLSPEHATFSFAGGGCSVRDENSLNGVYCKVARDTPIPLLHGTMFRIGQEILRYDEVPSAQLVGGVEPMGSPNPGYLGRLSLVIGRESHGNCFVVPPEGAHIGRERGDILFPDDGYVSGLHCRIHRAAAGGVVLTDVGSSNGTFVRIRSERKCESGELLLMGQQLFRLTF